VSFGWYGQVGLFRFSIYSDFAPVAGIDLQRFEILLFWS